MANSDLATDHKQSESAALNPLSGDGRKLDISAIMPQIHKDFDELNSYIKKEQKSYAKGNPPTEADKDYPPHWIRKEGENYRAEKVFGQELDELVNRSDITPGARRMAEFLSGNERVMQELYSYMPLQEINSRSKIEYIDDKTFDVMAKSLDPNFRKNPIRNDRLVSAAAHAELCGMTAAAGAIPLLYIPTIAGPVAYGAAVIGAAGACAKYHYGHHETPENYYAERRKILDKSNVVQDLERLYMH